MRRIFIILSIVSVLPFAANAQLSKLMSKYHEKNGVTVLQDESVDARLASYRLRC